MSDDLFTTDLTAETDVRTPTALLLYLASGLLLLCGPAIVWGVWSWAI